MTARLEPTEWIARLGFVFAAALLGLLAGYSPEVAVAAAIAVAFVILTMADLRIGLAMFVIVIFIETAEVAPGLGLAKVAGAALAFSWLALVLTDPDSRRFIWSDHPFLTSILVTILGWLLISATWSVNSGIALDHATRWLLSAALFPITYTAIRSKSDFRLIVGAFVVGAGGSALIGIATPPDPIYTDTVQRLTSTIGDPNEFAATLVAGFVLSMALIWGTRSASVSRAALMLIGLLCIIALFLTASRGGVVALIAALAVAPVLAPRKARIFTGAGTLVAASAIYLLTFAPAGTIDRLQERDGGSGRTDIWSVAWRVIEDRPIAGVGVGNFPTASVEYVIQPGALPDKRTLIVEPSVAHNIYLEVWAELGIIGLALFATFLIWCLLAAIRASLRFRSKDEIADAALAAGVAVSLVALFTAYVFLSAQTDNKLWLLLALCPVLLTLSTTSRREKTDQIDRPRDVDPSSSS